MIFEPMISVQAEHERYIANVSHWGGSKNIKAPENPNEIHATRRTALVEQFECVPLEAFAEIAGVDATEYEQKAQANEALLFITEAGEKLVPTWSVLEDGSVNPVALKVAKFFRDHRAAEGVMAFCRFMHNEVMMLSADHLYAETGEQNIISSEFKPRLFERFSKESTPKGLSRNLQYAVTMATGKNKAYVEHAIDGLINHLTAIGHKDDTLKAVFWHLPKPGKPFPKPEGQ